MSRAYSSEPITFENIVSNRPNFEVVENSMLLTFFFFDSSLEITNIYLEHNEVDEYEDIFFKGMIVSLNTFFTQDNLEKFREYLDDYRQRKVDNNEKKDELEKIPISLDNEISHNNKCSCDFCKIFNNANDILNNYVPKNNAEIVILEVMKSDAPKNYINDIILNPENYNIV
jgi:hypothetical protein